MKNITVTIADDVYHAARVWTAQRGTSVSRVVQHMLSTLPGIPRAQASFPLRSAAAPAPGHETEEAQTL